MSQTSQATQPTIIAAIARARHRTNANQRDIATMHHPQPPEPHWWKYDQNGHHPTDPRHQPL